MVCSPADPFSASRDLRPVRTMLRTKKLKRCRTCRHILVKPEPKISVIKFKMRLLAKYVVPGLSLQMAWSPACPSDWGP